MSDNKVADMIKTAETGDSAKLNSLIKAGADVNGTDEDGYTALIKAAKLGHNKCVSVLIQAGADVNIVVTSVEMKAYKATNDQVTALIEASEKGHDKCVEALLEAGADVTFKNGYERTALINAAENGHSKCLELLLETGKYNNVEDPDNNEKEDAEEDSDDGVREVSRALIVAAGNGHCECIQLLVNAGADVNAEDKKGNAPLINAAESGCEKCVKILIEEGAMVNMFTVKEGNIMEVDEGSSIGVTPVFAAASRGHHSCLKLLIQAGADVNTTDALPRAAWFGHSTCLVLLIEARADVNKCDYVAEVEPLIHAAREAHDDAVDVLLKAGADVNSVDTSDSQYSGHTALSMGSHYGRGPFDCYEHDSNEKLKARIRIIKNLLRAGAHVNIKNNEGQTALEYKIAGSAWATSDERDELNKVMIMLLFAAGDTIDGTSVTLLGWFRDTFPQSLFPDDTVPVRVYIQQHCQPSTCLKDLCRKTIRKHLLQLDPNTNLFTRVPALNLPDLLADYLLYNMSLHDDDADVQ